MPPRRKRKLDLIAPEHPSKFKTQKGRILSSATRIFIIKDKLTEEEIDDLRIKVIELGGMNSSLSYATLILTSLRAEKRILRHLDRDVLGRKVPVLHLSWLFETFEEKLLQSYNQYSLVSYASENDTKEAADVALTVSSQGSQQHESDVKGLADGCVKSKVETDEESVTEEEGDMGGFGSREGSMECGEELPQESGAEIVADKTAHDQGPEWHNVEYACLRPSPLKTRYNEALVDELEILRLQRVQSGNQEVNATAYGRAISAVKALPFALAPNPHRSKQIKGIGPKIAKLIAQFYSQGHIAEAQLIRNDHGFQVMSQFMELYGVGPKRAREYYSQGARTLDDVIRMGGSLGTHLHVEECLRILPDLRCKIPRDEVVEIAQLIQTELDSVRPGCIHTVCGGFRRGKLESNDVDIVITDPNPTTLTSQVTCMEELLRQLKKKALITHVVNVTTPSSTFEAVYSHLDIAEVVLLPPTSAVVAVSRYRRVDIIFCPHRTYGAAILGWTGSRQFERDLRLLAKHRGFKFHSTGIVNQNDSRPYQTPREEDIFELLQIPYMPPHLRNCDA
ncbi:hypothetical protein CBS101457_000437 [Exobasidium rhododendri]|nr:hypothetical protein CBS101457_000437 [Exobasidium rhododendri]